MRKYFIALIAVALVFAVTAVDFASAADIKMTGVMRMRGHNVNDADQNSNASDGRETIDSLWRPRWTMTSLGGKIKGTLELDATGATTSANGAGRSDAQWNRYIVDFLIPGSTMRFRFGRSDWTSPDRQIFNSVGTSRNWGYGLYGKINKNLSLNAWDSQTSEGGAAASDANVYHAALTYKASRSLTLSPWVAFDVDNGVTASTVAVNAASTDRKLNMYGLNAKAKMGIASLDVSGVIQRGKLDFGRGVNDPTLGNRKDTDVAGYAILVKLWLNFGKMKLGFNGVFMPGDDDPTSAAGDLGTQFDNKLTRFVAADCVVDGPQIITRRRFHTTGSGFRGENRCGSGNGGANGNGSQILELLATYKVSKALSLTGNVSLISSAAKRADVDTTGDGVADGATFKSSKNVGTEIDVSAKYDIYKGLWVRGTYSHLFAGDYGVANTAAGVATVDNDDTTMMHFELRYTF